MTGWATPRRKLIEIYSGLEIGRGTALLESGCFGFGF